MKKARKDTLDHVLKDVMEMEDGDFLLKDLEGNGIRSIPELLALSNKNNNIITFTDPSDGKVYIVPVFKKNRFWTTSFCSLPFRKISIAWSAGAACTM